MLKSLSLLLFLSLGVHSTEVSSRVASAPGDFLIAGLFPFHAGVQRMSDTSQPDPSRPQPPVCVALNKHRITQALAMIQAVEEANRSPILTRVGVTLGYRIYDSCSDVTTILRKASVYFMQGSAWSEGGDGDCQSRGNSSERAQPVMAVVGSSFSELSIALARLLTLELIPQISYSSTATILSDKARFPAFMRTVPNDLYQTRAMVKLLSDNHWDWVGVITTDGDYGRSALESFASEAKRSHICLAFTEILPGSVTDPKVNSSIHKAVQVIRDHRRAKVIVSFAKPEYMRRVFKELQEDSAEDRVWIASDGWSSAVKELAQHNFTSFGKVVAFTFKSGNTSTFYQYLEKLNASEDIPFMGDFLQSVDADKVTAVLWNYTYPTAVFSIQMAISAISQAIADICSENNDCKTPGAVKPWQLLNVLSKTEFKKEGKIYSFDEHGDVNLGYDISIWTNRMNNVVAEYHPHNNSIAPISREMRGQLSLLKSVWSKCSNSCQPGEMKKTVEGQQHTCCYDCIDCPENHYSNGTDMDQCLSCNASIEWAAVKSQNCSLKRVEQLDWDNGFAIVLLTLAALGVVMALVVVVLFLWQRNTPVVKAAGGPLCQIILFSLMGSFVSVVFFVGEPSSITCKVRQVLFGLSFTLCVSCILVKSLKILLAFHFNPALQEALRRLYKPYAIVLACVGLQALVCILWLVLCSPKPVKTPGAESSAILFQCDECSYAAFGTMLAYIAVLALVCFGFAFKGRKLPGSYNEAKFITFGMLIYLISWVIFIPVYVTTNGMYLPAVEMVVILLSNYGILCCHFLPKCYIILFKKQHNTKDAFLKNVYEYSQKSTKSADGSTGLDPVNKTNSQVFAISRMSVYLPSSMGSVESSTCTVNTETTVSQSTGHLIPKPQRLKRTFSV